jgi:hypothetical protein
MLCVSVVEFTARIFTAEEQRVTQRTTDSFFDRLDGLVGSVFRGIVDFLAKLVDKSSLAQAVARRTIVPDRNLMSCALAMAASDLLAAGFATEGNRALISLLEQTQEDACIPLKSRLSYAAAGVLSSSRI